MKSIKALPVKVLLAVIMILASSFSMPAYGADGDSPAEAVVQDIEASKEYILENGINGVFDLRDYSGYTQEDMEMLSQKLSDFDYEIIGEDVEGDTAAVTVKVTTYNFGKELQKIIRGIFFDGLFSFSDDSISEEEIVEILRERLGGLEKKKYTEEVVINCTKEDGEWSSDLESNEEFRDAVYGGVVSVLRKYEEYL